jgi:hypothetical protein
VDQAEWPSAKTFSFRHPEPARPAALVGKALGTLYYVGGLRERDDIGDVVGSQAKDLEMRNRVIRRSFASLRMTVG